MSGPVNEYSAQYGHEVHAAYKTMGSKLRNTVRVRNNIAGAIACFNRVGNGTASTKSPHGKVPVINGNSGEIECQLYTYYAGDWLDKLDELKADIDERTVLVNAGAYALGRKTDELINMEMDKSTNYALDGTTGLTKNKVDAAFQMLEDAEIPDDGERYAIVGWKQWSDLMAIDDFAKANYISTDELPWKGTQAKRWLGTLWMPHSGLTKSSNVRYCYWYHKNAIGHACGSEVKTEITYQGDRASWFINNFMSQGAALIDPAGIVSMRCLEP